MYKVGDRLTIVSERPTDTEDLGWDSRMDEYLGQTLTVKEVKLFSNGKEGIMFQEAYCKSADWFWRFKSNWVFPEETTINVSTESIISLLE